MPDNAESVNTNEVSECLYFSACKNVEFLSDGSLRINGEFVKEGDNKTNFNEDSARTYMRGECYTKESHIQNITKADNLLIFTGAGSSLFLKTPQSGKSMNELYKSVFAENTPPIGITNDKNKDWLFSQIKFSESDKEDLELLISRIEISLAYYTNKDEEYNALLAWRKHILQIIKAECSFSEKIDFDASVHANFMSKTITRKLSYNRTKIFTLNYDTAFEKGAKNAEIVLIDGFNFSDGSFFDNNCFDYDIVKRKGSRISDEDNFLPNIAYLYKLHGSINWHARNDKIIKAEIDDRDDFVMIMPSENKYEQSYKTPYFDLMARFQAELRKPLPSTLLIIGYSFRDEHINSMIMEAVNRSNFNVVIVSPTIPTKTNGNKMQKKLLAAVPQGNIAFVGDYFADFAKNFPIQKVYENSNDGRKYER